MSSMKKLHEHLVCANDMLDGYMNMYPSYNTFQLCNGVCTQFIAENGEQYVRLCSELVPVLIKYYAPFSISSPLRCNQSQLAITLYEGDWDIELFFDELACSGIMCTEDGRLKSDDCSYRMRFVSYTNYNSVACID